MTLLRSMLFTPGNNEPMMRKTGTLGADAVILDLEDAVPMAEKGTARDLIRDSARRVAAGGSRVFVRINALSTGLAADDLRATFQSSLAGVVLPKTEAADDVIQVSDWMSGLERMQGLASESLALIPLLETSRGILAAKDIVTASSRIIAVAFGALDFSRDMGISLSKEGQEILYAMSHVALVARAAGVTAIDSPCVEFRDLDQLQREAQRARRLGFRGKLLIHPCQIGWVHRIFSPSDEQLAYAQRVKEAFECAEARGRGAVSLDGTMIDTATLRQAEEVLSWAEAIRSRGGDSQLERKSAEA
jgi:citrate lyase subunit beta/citryl-CoA lyase